MSAIFFFCFQLLCQSIVLSLENARCHTPNLTAVYGCTSDKVWISPGLVLSIVSLTESLRSTWLASDCNRWCEASYHLLATDTRQQRLTLEYKPWYHCGANSKMVVVTTLRSDMRLFVPLFFESSLYIHCSLSWWVHKYWTFWMVGLLCHLMIIFTMNYLFW
jgi:hypothetical protein